MNEFIRILAAFAVGLLVGSIGGALIYRKNQPRIEKIRAQGEILGDALRKK